MSKVLFFWGFANFYHKFIKDYFKIAISLTNLTKKDAKWVWDNNAEQAFKGLKKQFTKKLILRWFNQRLKIKMETDLSDRALGACLS